MTFRLLIMPEFLKLPADLILVVYRLIINVAVWQFINMIRVFSVQTAFFQFQTCFWSKQKKKKKGGGGRWPSKEEICLDFIKWRSGFNILWTRHLLITKVVVEGKSLQVNCSLLFVRTEFPLVSPKESTTGTFWGDQNVITHRRLAMHSY